MKVLAGSLHKAFAFAFAEWKALLGVSLAPLILSLVLGVGQMLLFRHYFESMIGMIVPGEFNPAMINAMMQLQAFSLVSQIIALLITGYLFVRIVRLYMYGERGVFDFSKPVVGASLMTAVYSLGIFLLTMVAFFVAFIVFMILVAIIAGTAAAVGSDSPAMAVFAGLLGFVGGLGLCVLMLWFAARFAVGLPAVALGKTPDFFKDMWRLSRGETWGVPLRLLGLYALMLILLIPVMAFLGYRLFSQIVAGGNTLPEAEVVRLITSGMFDGFLWLVPLFTILGTVFSWLGTVLLTEAYLRFMKRDGKPAT